MNRQTSMHVQLSTTHSTQFSKTRQRALAAAGSCAPGQWDDGALTRSNARRPGDHCRKVSFDCCRRLHSACAPKSPGLSLTGVGVGSGKQELWVDPLGPLSLRCPGSYSPSRISLSSLSPPPIPSSRQHDLSPGCHERGFTSHWPACPTLLFIFHTLSRGVFYSTNCRPLT